LKAVKHRPKPKIKTGPTKKERRQAELAAKAKDIALRRELKGLGDEHRFEIG